MGQQDSRDSPCVLNCLAPSMAWRRPSDPANLFSPPVLLGSLGLSGFAPILRGTSGTAVAALGLALWAYLAAPPSWQMLAAGGLLALLAIIVGEWATARGEAGDDPDWFVLDEAAAMALILGMTQAATLPDFCFAFVVFRFYDIAKPWPASSFEHLPRSAGILMDDLAAACLGSWTIWTVRLLVNEAPIR